MKAILILAGIILIGWVLVKVVFPLIGKLLKYFLATFIPVILVVVAAIILFIGVAAFVGMTRSPDGDGGTSMTEEYEQVENINQRIEDRIDSMEGGKLDMWIKKKQKAYNEKHP